MSDLSIFVDESGDFGPYSPHCPLYLLTLVFHEQDRDISEQIAHLSRHVAELGFPPQHAVHAGPLIRRESDYAHMDLPRRRRLFSALFNFTRLCGVRHKTFVFRKRELPGRDEMVTRMSRELGLFVRERLAYFQGFDRIVVYYDNGQKEVTNVINAVFNTLVDAEVRKVRPSDYRLFQAADMACTLELVAQKKEAGALSRSEEEFFGSAKRLKTYLRQTAASRMG
ncbi:MAG: DUF3800 domain-containing protein [Coriobacteriales bacterium]